MEEKGKNKKFLIHFATCVQQILITINFETIYL